MLLKVKLSISIKKDPSENSKIDDKLKLFKTILSIVENYSIFVSEYGICTNSLEYEFTLEEINLHAIKKEISDFANHLDLTWRETYMQKCS